MSSESTSRSELFLKGAATYLDALAALEAFQQEVEAMCTKVYSRHKDRILSAMGLNGDGGFERYVDGDPAERWATLGIRRGTQKSGLNGPCFHLYVYFGESEDGTKEIEATVWLDCSSSRRTRDDIYDQIRRKKPRCRMTKDDEGTYYGLYLETPIKLDELSSLPGVLSSVVLEWIDYCESIGGLNLRAR
jgi:hypothetical protein